VPSFTAENGHFYALKGLAQEDEMANLPEGVVIKEVVELHVPQLEGERHLVVIQPKMI
jgi:16S rRNA (guanine527-N7)-methyltransferase